MGPLSPLPQFPNEHNKKPYVILSAEYLFSALQINYLIYGAWKVKGTKIESSLDITLITLNITM